MVFIAVIKTLRIFLAISNKQGVKYCKHEQVVFIYILYTAQNTDRNIRGLFVASLASTHDSNTFHSLCGINCNADQWEIPKHCIMSTQKCCVLLLHIKCVKIPVYVQLMGDHKPTLIVWMTYWTQHLCLGTINSITNKFSIFS